MRATLGLTFIIGAVLAAPSPRAGHVLHEKRATEPVDWVQTRRLESDHILPLRIGLSQSNLDKIEDMLMAVSHPKSPTYGQHYTPKQVIDAFSPSDVSIGAVKDWLSGFGFSEDRMKLSNSRGWLEVANATTAEIEDLLNTEYHVYTHTETGMEQISMSISHYDVFLSYRGGFRLPLLLCSPPRERTCRFDHTNGSLRPSPTSSLL